MDLVNGRHTILIGEALARLRDLPDASIHCAVTSPPYFGLRNYADQTDQIGLEATPDEYVARLVGIFREVRRVLRDDGTFWLNVGDSYANRQRQSGDEHAGEISRRNKGQITEGTRPLPSGYKEKDLIGTPWLLAFALRADGWYLRQEIIWAKKVPMPESVHDRCTRSHEHIFMLSKSPAYFYDHEAIKEPVGESMQAAIDKGQRAKGEYKHDSDTRLSGGKAGVRSGNRVFEDAEALARLSGGRNKRDVWWLSNSPSGLGHHAMFPPQIPLPCIRAGTSEKGCCPTCGAPWVRTEDKAWSKNCACTFAEPVPCRVLDPFHGSGTTGAVAEFLGRHYTGIELNAQYTEIYDARCAEVRRSLIGGDAPDRSEKSDDQISLF